MKRQPSLLEHFIAQVITEELAEIGPPPPPPQALAKGGIKPPPPPPQASQKQGQAPAAPAAPVKETGNLSTDAKAIVDVNKDKLQKKGINVAALKQLGVGTMGVAYDMGDKVLKVTKDAREAKASSIVAGKNTPNIVQVYDIWKFPGVEWYGLIIEKLTPLSKEEEGQLTAAVINTKFPMLLHQAGDDWNKAMQMLAQQTMQALVKQAYTQFPSADPGKGGQGISDPQVKQFLQTGATKTIQDFDKVTKEYNMRGLFKSLKALGVQYYDFHGGNYGRRGDGTLVLFDLGRSISKGAMPAELTERFKILEVRFGSPQPILVLR